ncbi:MAG TPA: ATP-binding protein [Gemmatimonadaceae bacterium]|jgi:predicted AAA+ superfamily ATPase|nr:ATP-binding protein [Gemmatimonadaceae bacterium]
MPTTAEILRATNPWWVDGSLTDDPHLKRFDASPVRWDPPALTVMPLTFGDTHTLRGPRQVGKTTTLKRLIRQLVQRGETRVLYHAFDLTTDAREFVDIIRQAKTLHPAPEGPWYLFLDEVAAVPDWQVGVKVAWDSGLTADDAIVLTASSAHDLKRGSERLPGRRGNGRDYVQLPMSFRDFCHVAYNLRFPDEPLAVEEFLTPRGQKIATRLMAFATELQCAFDAYVRVGGFPVAVRDHRQRAHDGVAPATIEKLWNIVAGDVAKTHRNQLAALKLLQTVGASLGSPLSWLTAARGMGVEKPDTAKQYAELLAETFVLLTVYFWDPQKRSLEPNKQRKVYWSDPIIGQMPAVLIPGTARPSADGLVEGVVASGLFRSAAQTLIQANAVPGTVGYWRSGTDREIDFMIPRVTDLERERLPVEVKGDNTTGLAGARAAILRTYREGLVLSRTVFDWRSDIATLPVWLLLAGVSEQPLRSEALA